MSLCLMKEEIFFGCSLGRRFHHFRAHVTRSSRDGGEKNPKLRVFEKNNVRFS